MSFFDDDLLGPVVQHRLQHIQKPLHTCVGCSHFRLLFIQLFFSGFIAGQFRPSAKAMWSTASKSTASTADNITKTSHKNRQVFSTVFVFILVYVYCISLHIHIHVHRPSNCCFFSLLWMLSQPCRSCSCAVSCHAFMKLFYEQINWWWWTLKPHMSNTANAAISELTYIAVFHSAWHGRCENLKCLSHNCTSLDCMSL